MGISPIPSDDTVKRINNYPLAFAVAVFFGIAGYFVNQFTSQSDARNDDCMEQVKYLRERIDKLENAYMVQEGKVKNLTDSLAVAKEGS